MAFGNSPLVLGAGSGLPAGAVSLVGGPASSTDNSIVRWDGTTGNLVQNSVLIVADTTGALSGFTTGVGITFHGGGTLTGASGALTLTTPTLTQNALTGDPTFVLSVNGTTGGSFLADGANLYISGGAGDGVILRVNTSTTVLTLDTSLGATVVGDIASSTGIIRSLSFSSLGTNAVTSLQVNNQNAAVDALSLSTGTVTNSSGQYDAVAIKPTYNQTSTAAATDLLINRTQTAVGSGTQRLIDAQVGGSSKFSVSNAGVATVVGDIVKSAGDNGQSLNIKYLTELTTIAAAAFTDTTIQIPANAVVLAVSVRVTVAIGAPVTAFDYGVSGATTRYGAAISKAAGTTWPGTNDGARYYAAAVSIRITPDNTPPDTVGRVRVSIMYYDATPPTS